MAAAVSPGSIIYTCEPRPFKLEYHGFEYEGIWGFEAELKCKRNDRRLPDRALAILLVTENVSACLQLQRYFPGEIVYVSPHEKFVPYAVVFTAIALEVFL